MQLFGFYLVKKARIGLDLICLYLFVRLEGAVFGFDLACIWLFVYLLLLFPSCFLPQAPNVPRVA